MIAKSNCDIRGREALSKRRFPCICAQSCSNLQYVSPKLCKEIYWAQIRKEVSRQYLTNELLGHRGGPVYAW